MCVRKGIQCQNSLGKAWERCESGRTGLASPEVVNSSA